MGTLCSCLSRSDPAGTSLKQVYLLQGSHPPGTLLGPVNRSMSTPHDATVGLAAFTTHHYMCNRFTQGILLQGRPQASYSRQGAPCGSRHPLQPLEPAAQR